MVTLQVSPMGHPLWDGAGLTGTGGRKTKDQPDPLALSTQLIWLKHLSSL